MKANNLLIISIISAFFSSAAFSETRITYKSAKSTSSYYQMGVQISDTIKKSTNGGMILTIEECQRGSSKKRKLCFYYTTSISKTCNSRKSNV